MLNIYFMTQYSQNIIYGGLHRKSITAINPTYLLFSLSAQKLNNRTQQKSNTIYGKHKKNHPHNTGEGCAKAIFSWPIVHNPKSFVWDWTFFHSAFALHIIIYDRRSTSCPFTQCQRKTYIYIYWKGSHKTTQIASLPSVLAVAPDTWLYMLNVAII